MAGPSWKLCEAGRAFSPAGLYCGRFQTHRLICSHPAFSYVAECRPLHKKSASQSALRQNGTAHEKARLLGRARFLFRVAATKFQRQSSRTDSQRRMLIANREKSMRAPSAYGAFHSCRTWPL